MSREITQRELRNDSGAILREVEAGETIIVTRRGVPVAEMTALRHRRPTLVSAAVALESAAKLPHIDAAQFRADLDAVIDQDLLLDLGAE